MPSAWTELYNTSIEITRYTHAVDAWGGNSPTSVVLFTGVNGRLNPAGGSELARFGTTDASQAYNFFLDEDDILTSGTDVIKPSDTATIDSVVYEIKTVDILEEIEITGGNVIRLGLLRSGT